MINDTPKIRIRRYACYHCNCTGFHAKKQIIFQIWNWGYQFINREICTYCHGKGFVQFERKYEKTNAYQSFLEH